MTQPPRGQAGGHVGGRSGPQVAPKAAGSPGFSEDFGQARLSGTPTNGATQKPASPTGTAGAPSSRLSGAAAAASAKVSAAKGAAKAGAAAAGRSRGPRRARLQLRHIDPWTVLKFSCVLSIALFVVWMLTVGVLYSMLQASGVVSSINDSVMRINGAGSDAPLTWKIVLGGASVIGVLNIVLFIALSTIGSVVYNLCADLVGGIEVTLSERES